MHSARRSASLCTSVLRPPVCLPSEVRLWTWAPLWPRGLLPCHLPAYASLWSAPSICLLNLVPAGSLSASLPSLPFPSTLLCAASARIPQSFAHVPTPNILSYSQQSHPLAIDYSGFIKLNLRSANSVDFAHPQHTSKRPCSPYELEYPPTHSSITQECTTDLVAHPRPRFQAPQGIIRPGTNPPSVRSSTPPMVKMDVSDDAIAGIHSVRTAN